MDYGSFIIIDGSDEDVMPADAGLALAVSDDDSQLSEAPSDLMDVDETFESGWNSPSSQVNVLQPRRCHAGLSRGFVVMEEVKSDDQDNAMEDELQSEMSDFGETDVDTTAGGEADTSVKLGRTRNATIEALSTELLQIVASYLDDQDLNVLAISSPRILAVRLLPANAGQWKERFLSLYDEPILEGPHEYCVAYQHRRYVIRKFRGCGGGDKKALEGMQVIRDMIIETYYQPKAWLPIPVHSRNLAAFSAYSTSPLMVHFLSTSFYGTGKPHCKTSTFSKYQDLFDALQLVLSHLVLNVNSMYAIDIPTSREDYDIEKIYLWKKPFETVNRVAPEEDQLQSQPVGPGQMFPNLTPSPRPAPEPLIHLDLHGLLHIRNFWRRHLTEVEFGTSVGVGPFAGMAQVLKKYGKTPKKWDKPLESPLELSIHWVGHYSCIHTEKSKAELFEMQSCAFDWTDIDPLTLDIASTQNPSAGYWPPIFSTIPAFAKTTPAPSTATTTYIAGLAPFLDLHTLSETHSFNPHAERYHPFTALRVRGLIHAIPPQPIADDEYDADDEPIPGWHRITMVLYRPHIRYLVQVYEHACEDYGDPSQQTIMGETVADGAATTTMATAAVAATTFDAATGAAVNFDQNEYERRLRVYLDQQLAGLKGPVRVERSLVEQWDDGFLEEPGNVSWEDIEYAYAYEGIIIPGGKIMMGRWWRCAEAGFGEGREFFEGGGGDRGPWLFWADD